MLCFHSLKRNPQHLPIFCLFPHTSLNPFGLIFKIYTDYNSLSKLPQLPTSPMTYHPLVPEWYNSLLATLFLPLLYSRVFSNNRMIMWMRKSDHVTTLFKTLKWLCISQKSQSHSGLWALSWCAPPTLWSHLLTSPYPPLLHWIQWSFHCYGRMLLPYSEHFIYCSSACKSLSSDILIAPSLPCLLQVFVPMWPFQLGASLTTTFKVPTHATHFKLLILFFCFLFSPGQLPPTNTSYIF